MNNFKEKLEKIKKDPKTWLVTGVAGFIGSNLLEELLKLNQKVVGLDNLSTGFIDNLEDVQHSINSEQWKNFTFINSDIRNIDDCNHACRDVDYVLHQAALGSVSRSIEDPVSTNDSNLNGFLNIILASKDNQIKKFVYASSSSVYGDHEALPKVEENIGNQLSPYAITKYSNELYASVFKSVYDFDSIGLRYFNVFGKRQNPNGAYAAVIPKWIEKFKNSSDIYINGDGKTTRDFCYVDNAVQANIRAALSENGSSNNEIYNIACGQNITLQELHDHLKLSIADVGINSNSNLIYRDFRQGDIKNSLADISKAKKLLGYSPAYNVFDGLNETINWYLKNET